MKCNLSVGECVLNIAYGGCRFSAFASGEKVWEATARSDLRTVHHAMSMFKLERSRSLHQHMSLRMPSWFTFRSLPFGAGSAPDGNVQNDFNNLANHAEQQYPGNVKLVFSYDEPLSHLIYAARFPSEQYSYLILRNLAMQPSSMHRQLQACPDIIHETQPCSRSVSTFIFMCSDLQPGIGIS